MGGPAQPVQITAADGCVLHGQYWCSPPAPPATQPPATQLGARASGLRPVVVINPATSVRAAYYARFAQFLYEHGFDVLTWDYRGIGTSRPVGSLSALNAGWLEWGEQDLQAVLQWVAQHGAGQPIHAVGHSVGGFLIGLAPAAQRLERVFTVGAQFAHWPDYALAQRLPMWLRWHLVMPALTACCGYFPGARLGWLEDTPRGVVQDWTAWSPRLERIWSKGPRALPPARQQALVARFAALRGAILALSFTDDPFGTASAIERLLSAMPGCPRTHLRCAPRAFGLQRVGHFAFFHARHRPTLWPLAVQWLQEGRVADAGPQTQVRHWPAAG